MKLHKIAAALALSAVAFGSQAVPIISSFNATALGGFIAPTATCAPDFTNGTTANSQLACQASLNYTLPSGAVPAPVPANTPGFIVPLVTPALTALQGLPTFDQVNWGTAASALGQSGLGVTHNAALAPVVVNGAAVLLDTFTHFNRVITAGGGFMNSVLYYGEVDLAQALPFPGLAVPGVNSIGLNETLNVAGQCVAPNPNGSVCDDIFTTQPLEGTFQFYTDTGGTPYFVQFAFVNGSGGVVLPDVNPLNVDIWTAEGTNATVFTTIRIFTVPEPTMLALFGFGLVGVALSRRRKLS